MIGGRVLDASAVGAFVSRRSVFVSALVWTATEEDVVLLVPATAVVAATSTPGQDAVLGVLLGLPITVVDVLDARRAREVGEITAPDRLGDDVVATHAAACAMDRGWALVTAEPARYAALGDRIELDELP